MYCPPPGPPPMAVIVVSPVPVIEESLPAFPFPLLDFAAPPAPTATVSAVSVGKVPLVL